MLSLLKRYRELLVVATLLLYPFGAFLSQGGRGREPNWVDRSILALTSPLQRGLLALVQGGRDWVDAYVALRGVHEENLTLRKEAEQLRAQANQMVELRAENERLRRALGYGEASHEQELLARVVGFNPAPSSLSVRINRGETDGVREGMAVVTPDGVVGQVVRVTDSSSDVALLTDPQTKVGVRVQRSRARASVAGAGALRPLRLENALRTDDILEGDTLVTSGADGVFPAGRVVGRVQNLSRTDHGFQQANIQPAVDVRRIEEVLVITSPVERVLEPPPPPPAAAAVPTVGQAGGH